MRRCRTFDVIVPGLVFLAGFSGCKSSTGPNDESPSNIVFPTTKVSYSRHVQPLFNQACALSGCHDDGVPQGSLKLTSYGNTVLTLNSVVVQGKPDQSILVLRIQGSLGARMPPGNNPLNQNQINGIRTWVAEGAQDN
jgi:hypothetical protein